MSRACAYLLVWLALGHAAEVPGEEPDDTESPDIELLEFLGGLEDSDEEWQEFFGSMSEEMDAEEETDAN